MVTGKGGLVQEVWARSRHAALDGAALGGSFGGLCLTRFSSAIWRRSRRRKPTMPTRGDFSMIGSFAS